MGTNHIFNKPDGTSERVGPAFRRGEQALIAETMKYLYPPVDNGDGTVTFYARDKEFIVVEENPETRPDVRPE